MAFGNRGDKPSGKDPRAEAAPRRKGAGAAEEARPRRRRATATTHSDLGERLIAGVPARIMRPRLVFLTALAALLVFGLVMVYSASSITSLAENGTPYFMLGKQAFFMAIGLVIMALVAGRPALVPTALLKTNLSWVLWGVVLVFLVLVLFIGTGGDEWGAKRWIDLGVTTLQPGEFAKPAVIVVLAKILDEYYDQQSTDTMTFLISLFICLGVPGALIIIEPDLGTTLIIVAAAFGMAFVSGISWRLVAMCFGIGLAALVVAVLFKGYRLQRILIALDPWKDPFGDGYQATLAIMAFASGGLFGRGIGNATMKYHYLPEAHNDYIFAIIGEELGFVGAALFVAVFMALVGAGVAIARRSPTFYGQMLALGCSLILGVQFFVNVLGILAVTPMTGKPLPFVSYGGSSVLTSLILAGLILRVSLDSNVQTSAERRRGGMAVMDEEVDVSGHIGRSTAGEARVRSRSAGGPAPRRDRGLSVHDGGRSDRGFEGEAGTRPDRRASRGRIDLNESAADRLRRDRRDIQVDYHDISRAGEPRRSGDGRARRGDPRGSGRSRHDR